MTDCQEEGLTCVVTGVPPSTTSDWLARSQTQQVRWALDQTEWSITMWTEESGSRVWLNLRCSVSVSGFLSPGLWSFPVFSFWCLALQTHEWPHEGRFSNEWRQKLLHRAMVIPWTCAKTLQQRCRWPSRRARGLTSLAWGHIPAFWFVSPGPVSCSPALSSLPAEMPPEPGNIHAEGCKL